MVDDTGDRVGDNRDVDGGIGPAPVVDPEAAPSPGPGLTDVAGLQAELKRPKPQNQSNKPNLPTKNRFGVWKIPKGARIVDSGVVHGQEEQEQ